MPTQLRKNHPFHMGMIAGEPSGDLLAASLMSGLKKINPQLQITGIGGPYMQAQGLQLLHSMETLTVFGYLDALRRLPSLLSIYRNVKQHWLNQPPAVFVGIDAPDFNLRVEAQLRRAGIATVHFISPSIWAWRFDRIHTIRRAVSHMLLVFPFEEEIYRKEGITATYVGHPLASAIPLEPNRLAARRRLGIAPEANVLAIMTGSRASEIRILAPLFLQAAQILRKRDPKLVCIVPLVNIKRRTEFLNILKQYPVEGLQYVDAENSTISKPHSVESPIAWTALEACNAVLVASGTATLEAALFKRPMVISYVLSTWMLRLMQWKSGQQRPYLPWVGLPNVLLQDSVVPELLQDAATVPALAEATWKALMDKDEALHLQKRFMTLHHTLRQDTATLAAQVIWKVANGN